MVSIPTNGTESLLTVAIEMDELGDNKTKEGKWYDIWLMAHEPTIHL